MFANFLTVTLRNLVRRRAHTGINIAGLAIGMASCLLILLYARSEWSFDTFHEAADQIYRVNIRATTPGGDLEVKAGQPLPLARTLRQTVRGVEAATLMVTGRDLLASDGLDTYSLDVQFVEPDFFRVFTFPLIRGDTTHALSSPATAIVTRATAIRLWGTESVTGETLRMRVGDTFRDFRVTAVAEDPPGHSSIDFDVLLPIEAHEKWTPWADSWTSWVTNTFVRLAPDTDPDDVRSELPAFAARHFAPMIQTWQILQWIGTDAGDFALELQPLETIHFTPWVTQAETPTTHPWWPAFLLGLAIAVLVMASINFTTLSLGRASRRAREVGLRKTMGAGRGQLVIQFLGEACVLSLVSLGVAMALTEALLPSFSRLVETPLALTFSTGTVALLLGLALSTGLAAGAAPAVVMSRIGPGAAFRGAFSAGRPGSFLQVLVVLQFTFSIGFIMAVLVVGNQVRFLRQADPGFRPERVLVVETMTSDVEESERRVRQLRDVWESNAGVVAVGAASTGINKDLSWGAFGSADGEAHTLFTSRVDTAWLRVMNISLVAGHDFPAGSSASDTTSVIVNEALVREFGWDDPIGQTVNNYGQVVGVARDFHFKSMHSAVEPMLLSLASRGDAPFRYVFVRLAGGDMRNAVNALEAGWRSTVADAPFTWSFLDDDMDQLYADERRVAQLMAAAAVLAVLIACLGLFGLAAHAAERRTREIGIRKVVGAGTFAILRLLITEFVVLALVAAAVAVPLTWVQLQRWLGNFAYRIEIGWQAPLVSGLLGLTVALLAVSWHAVRAAGADPVKSLRSE